MTFATASRGTALVTGASRGIGAVYADRLARRGYDLILVARDTDRLQSLAAELSATSGRTVAPLPADLSRQADLGVVEARLREDRRITLLVNNAGVGAVAPLLGADVERMQAIVDLNVAALMRLTYAAAPGFAARGNGTIVNIASIVGLRPETLNGVYGASKAFVIAFSQSLQHELADKGVRIQVVLPGATATDLWERSGMPWQNLPSGTVMSPEDVVDAALAGLEQGEVVTIPGLPDVAEWKTFDAARHTLVGHARTATPAARYRVTADAF